VAPTVVPLVVADTIWPSGSSSTGQSASDVDDAAAQLGSSG